MNCILKIFTTHGRMNNKLIDKALEWSEYDSLGFLNNKTSAKHD
jgi:hypothetical protein